MNLTILRSIVYPDMKFIMIDAFKGASGKLCSHSDMGATYIGRTGATYSHKRCNNRNLVAMPYSPKELSQQSAFKTRSAAISAAIKALTDDQRKALLAVRNSRGLYSFRQLIEGIYDKTTNSIPTAALADLVAQGKKVANGSNGSNVPGGSSGEIDGDL